MTRLKPENFANLPRRRVEFVADDDFRNDALDHELDMVLGSGFARIIYPVYEGDEVLVIDLPVNERTLRSIELPDLVQILLDLFWWYEANEIPAPRALFNRRGGGNGLPVFGIVTERTLTDRTFLRALDILWEAVQGRFQATGQRRLDRQYFGVMNENGFRIYNQTIHEFFGWNTQGGTPKLLRNYDIMIQGGQHELDLGFGRRARGMANQASSANSVLRRSDLLDEEDDDDDFDPDYLQWMESKMEGRTLNPGLRDAASNYQGFHQNSNRFTGQSSSQGIDAGAAEQGLNTSFGRRAGGSVAQTGQQFQNPGFRQDSNRFTSQDTSQGINAKVNEQGLGTGFDGRTGRSTAQIDQPLNPGLRQDYSHLRDYHADLVRRVGALETQQQGRGRKQGLQDSQQQPNSPHQQTSNTSNSVSDNTFRLGASTGQSGSATNSRNFGSESQTQAGTATSSGVTGGRSASITSDTSFRGFSHMSTTAGRNTPDASPFTLRGSSTASPTPLGSPLQGQAGSVAGASAARGASNLQGQAGNPATASSGRGLPTPVGQAGSNTGRDGGVGGGASNATSTSYPPEKVGWH